MAILLLLLMLLLSQMPSLVHHLLLLNYLDYITLTFLTPQAFTTASILISCS